MTLCSHGRVSSPWTSKVMPCLSLVCHADMLCAVLFGRGNRSTPVSSLASCLCLRMTRKAWNQTTLTARAR